MCNGKPLKFGCRNDPNRNTALLRLRGNVIFFNGKMSLGDIAAVVHKDRIVFALVADQGPVCKRGEGSIEFHERLGHSVCTARNTSNECTKLRDLEIDGDVRYFVFAGSKANAWLQRARS